MDIKASLPLLQAIRTGATAAPLQAPGAARSLEGGASPAGSFSKVLGTALDKVNAGQIEAAELQRDYQYGKPEASLERTMIAMQTAQLQFQAAVTVRNRLVSAYTDIMNMPI
jgi:flagellar hook-basal body complex protein FliE